jgi:hypothetical protein
VSITLTNDLNWAYEAIHHMVDRLSPAQARRLRLLVTEPEQTEDTELSTNEGIRDAALGLASAGVRGRSPPGRGVEVASHITRVTQKAHALCA